MARRRCSLCPRVTLKDRTICYHCEQAARPRVRTWTNASPEFKDISAAEIEARFTAALTDIRRRQQVIDRRNMDSAE
jgi:hypothetical protein